MFDRPIKLVRGAGDEKSKCWMSAIAFWAGEPHSDAPSCVDNSIRRACIIYNDLLPRDEERAELITPILFAPLGTAHQGHATELRRAYMWVELASE